jgi:hypothetical protein
LTSCIIDGSSNSMLSNLVIIYAGNVSGTADGTTYCISSSFSLHPSSSSFSSSSSLSSTSCPSSYSFDSSGILLVPNISSTLFISYTKSEDGIDNGSSSHSSSSTITILSSFNNAYVICSLFSISCSLTSLTC